VTRRLAVLGGSKQKSRSAVAVPSRRLSLRGCSTARTRLAFLGGRYSAVPCSVRAGLVVGEFGSLSRHGIAPRPGGSPRIADVHDIDGCSARVKRGGEPPRPTRVRVVVVYAMARVSSTAPADTLGQASTTKSRQTASVCDATRLPSPAPGPQRRLSPARQELRKRSRQQVRSQLLRTAEARSIDTEPHWSPTRQVVRAQLFSSHAIGGWLAIQSTRASRPRTRWSWASASARAQGI
jgi:hypothetical protein